MEQWRTENPLITEPGFIGGAVCDGKFYAIDVNLGEGGGGVFDPKTGEWQSIPVKPYDDITPDDKYRADMI